jgi:hypothetical protein
VKGPKDAAMVILGMGGPSKKDRPHHDKDEDHDDEDYLDGEEEEDSYSDEQLMMAGELKSALSGGDEHDILNAIHGIMMSYKMDY